MEYKISREAYKDLENIWVYTFRNWSAKQADYYLNLIMEEIEYISENPESGKNYNKIRKGYYRSTIKSHFIFYRINENFIEIIRILHRRMDIDTRLS
ncbi:type II toxin-antitoxin system RelE/ParE family toxin [Weeksellaceae bacterium TAE3-ERU29]|nr:type II toxin-antitoxin system RelE/ParE family toxin [Weeksellaceae bacterium TAE3-ERU29]